MSSNSISSHYSNRRALSTEAYDRSVGQTLVTVVNDPRLVENKNSWLWNFTQDQSWQETPPALDATKYPNIQRQHLESLLQVMEGRYDQFMQNRQKMVEANEAATSSTSGRPMQGQGLVHAMQKVPADYFQDDFSLSRPDVMADLCNCPDDEAIHEKIEELTGYLDTVESQLLIEIASRTVPFFEAAGSLQELRAVLGDALDEVRRLRGQVASTDDSAYRAALTVTRLQRRRGNLQAMVDHLKDVEEVEGSWGVLQAVLDGGDFAGGLELLHNIRHSLQQLAAAGVGSLAALRPRVEDSIVAVEGLLVGELLAAARFSGLPAAVERTLQAAVARLEGRETEDAAGGAEGGEGGDPAREQLHDLLLPLVVGLHRAERLLGVMSQYRENSATEAKAAVRGVLEGLLLLLLQPLPSEPLAAEGHHGRDTQLAEKLQLLEHVQFMVLLEAVSGAVGACVQHCRLVGVLMEDILSGVKAPRGHVQALRREVEAAVAAVLEVGLARWGKVLGARTQVHVRLRVSELQEVIRRSEAFVAGAEAGGVRATSAFRTAVQAQCKAFLEHMHGRCINNLQCLLEAEQWVQVQVPPDFQAIVDRLAASGSQLLAADSTPQPELREARQGAGGVGGGAATVVVGGVGYHVVNSGLMLLKLVEELMALTQVVPVFGAEVAHKVVELLKRYNSQSCQLVLGAGATRTAGLKSISAKHLALSCQMLALIAALQPLLRAALVAGVPPPRKALLVPEFDRLLQDVNLHRDEIHSKLVDIMQDRLLAAVRTLAAESDAWAHPGAPIEPSPTVRTLTKQLLTLNSVLAPILLEAEVGHIFSRVASLYSDTLADTLQQLPSRGDHWEAKCRANVLHILDTFRQLPLPPSRAPSLLSRLNTYYTKHFGPPPDPSRPSPPKATARSLPSTTPPPSPSRDTPQPPPATSPAHPAPSSYVTRSPPPTSSPANLPAHPAPVGTPGSSPPSPLQPPPGSSPPAHPTAPLDAPHSTPSPGPSRPEGLPAPPLEAPLAGPHAPSPGITPRPSDDAASVGGGTSVATATAAAADAGGGGCGGGGAAAELAPRGDGADRGGVGEGPEGSGGGGHASSGGGAEGGDAARGVADEHASNGGAARGAGGDGQSDVGDAAAQVPNGFHHGSVDARLVAATAETAAADAAAAAADHEASGTAGDVL